MAIEFNCPYCTAAIRVPASAAGKKGTCPSCSTKLIVPVPSGPGPAGDAAANEPPIVFEGVEEPVAPRSPPVPPVPADERTDEQPVVETPRTSVARSLKRRRRRRGMGWLVPLALAGPLIGILIYAVSQHSGDAFGGQIAATDLGDTLLDPVVLTTSDLGVKSGAFDQILDDLSSGPQRILSELIDTEVRAGMEGVEAFVGPTDASRLIAVSLGSDPDVKAWLSENVKRLEQLRQNEFHNAARSLFDDWDPSTFGVTLESYRNEFILNSHRLGLGFAVEVLVDNRIVPCVHQDRGGRVYFVIPKAASRFIVRGRTLSDGVVAFPGVFEATVTSSVQPAEPETSPDDSESEAMEEDNPEDDESMPDDDEAMSNES